jgi:hypothetical protein
MIVDAQGVYHDISKHAFDAWSVLNPDSQKHLQSQLFKHPLAESIKMITRKAGVDLSSFDFEDFDAKALARQAAAAVGEAVGAKAIGLVPGLAAKALGFVEGTAATGGLLAVGVAIEVAVEWAVRHWNDAVETFGGYKKGDWVIVDKGKKTQVVLDTSLPFGLEDASTMISELHVLQRHEDYHVGFFVSVGEDAGHVTVFDLVTGDARDYPQRDVRLLPQAERGRLDTDKVASNIRELYFTETDSVYMECETQCEPGTEVIFQESLWHIEHCDGDVALIENDQGERQHVGMGLLSRSRQERIGPQHVYKKGKAQEATGFVTQPGGYGTGDWVWIDYEDGAKKHLGCVHIINGPEVVMFMTLTGTIKRRRPGQVRPASRDDSDTFNRIKEFAMFRAAAVEGADTVRLRIPAKYRPLIVRETPSRRAEPEVAKRPQPTFRDNSSAQPVTTQEEAGRVDRLIEMQETTGVAVQGALEAIAHKNQCIEEERRRLTVDNPSCPPMIKKRAEPDMSPDHPHPAKRQRGEAQKSNQSAVILGAGCAVLALLYFAGG